MSSTRIIELSARIAANTAVVNDYLVDNSLPTPSFDLDAPQRPPIPSTEPGILAARQAIISDCLELRQLMLGPRDHIVSYKVGKKEQLIC